MSVPTDQELIERWRGEPAPLLPLLHDFHDRDGYLSDDALRAVADGLRTPLADLYGTVTFHHHFSREPGGKERPRTRDAWRRTLERDPDSQHARRALADR